MQPMDTRKIAKEVVVLFESASSTTIEKHFEYAVIMTVDATVYQEHKIPTSDQEKGYA